VCVCVCVNMDMPQLVIDLRPTPNFELPRQWLLRVRRTRYRHIYSGRFSKPKRYSKDIIGK